MGKANDKELVIQHKKNAIRKLNSLLERYISEGTTDSLKKTDLLSYWLESYANYISFESTFDSTRLPRYKRGSVLRVNFGFNIGKELGGLHLAVVLDNDNKRNADVITVVPLSSTDGKSVHPRSVDLKSELYEKVSSHHLQLLTDIRARNNQVLDLITQHHITLTDPAISTEEKAALGPVITQLNNDAKEISSVIDMLENHRDEINRMKQGSMAVINQITTISKQRIYIPKKSTDFLYGITLSPEAMDKINAKIKELYFF